jgi:hypothetical protein
MTIEAQERLDVASRAIKRSRSLYFRLPDARALVEECEVKDLAVVRIEALSLDGGAITPRMDWILDCLAMGKDWSGFTWEQFRHTCNEAALQFLDRAPADKSLIFYFSLVGRDEAGFLSDAGRDKSWVGGR